MLRIAAFFTTTAVQYVNFQYYTPHPPTHTLVRVNNNRDRKTAPRKEKKKNTHPHTPKLGLRLTWTEKQHPEKKEKNTHPHTP